MKCLLNLIFNSSADWMRRIFRTGGAAWLSFSSVIGVWNETQTDSWLLWFQVSDLRKKWFQWKHLPIPSATCSRSPKVGKRNRNAEDYIKAGIVCVTHLEKKLLSFSTCPEPDILSWQHLVSYIQSWQLLAEKQTKSCDSCPKTLLTGCQAEGKLRLTAHVCFFFSRNDPEMKSEIFLGHLAANVVHHSNRMR